MRKLHYIVLFLTLAGNVIVQPVRAQNLVPNPSFETYSSCPFGWGGLYLALPWFNPTVATPDYLHSCSVSINTSVPQSTSGYQYARTGEGYAAIMAKYLFTADYREYIEVKLLDTLETGKTYCISFYINLADSSKIATDRIGLHLSNDSIFDSSTWYPFPYIPQIQNSFGNILNDKQNWVLISGQYMAMGGERFITIGNFYTDANTTVDTVTQNTFTNSAYYFIDDVYVGTCDTGSTTPPNDTLIIPNVFTPNGDGVNDVFTIQSEGIENISCVIYNRWGIKVAEFTLPGQGWEGRTTSGQDAAEGVYYYIFTGLTIDGQHYKRTGFIQLIR